MTEEFAKAIFLHAIKEERCAELLETLFDGGSVTYDPVEGKLVMIDADTLSGFGGG